MNRRRVLEWLAQREPRPPEALTALIRETVRTVPDECLTGRVADCLAAVAQHTLQAVLAAPTRSRDTARQLLVADSLVTYALEAESGEGRTATFDAFARRITA